MPSTQLKAIITDLERHKTIFDADQVGDRVLDIAAHEAFRRFDAAIDPDGNAWPELSAEYEAWKARNAIGFQIGVLEGSMAGDLEEFKGERPSPTKTEASSTYGTSELARDHAEWFEEGDAGRNRPPRPFTAMSDAAVQLIDDFLDQHHQQSL